MSTEPVLDNAGRRRTRRVVLVSLAIVGTWMLLVVFAVWQIYAQAQRYKQITPGMTVDEVVALLGEPRDQTKAGQPLNPPMVVVPAGTKHKHAYTYLLLATFVYVLFDEQDRVVVYYTYHT